MAAGAGVRPSQPQQQMRPMGMPPPQQQQRQVVHAAEAVPAARRMIKKRKAPDQQLADKVWRQNELMHLACSHMLCKDY